MPMPKQTMRLIPFQNPKLSPDHLDQICLDLGNYTLDIKWFGKSMIDIRLYETDTELSEAMIVLNVPAGYVILPSTENPETQS